jgi:hypothetical protein
LSPTYRFEKEDKHCQNEKGAWAEGESAPKKVYYNN